MGKNKDQASLAAARDEELIDTLIAISVVAKRLASKLRESEEKESEEKTDE